MKFLSFLTLFFITFFAPQVLFAAEIDAGSDLTIENSTISENYYAAGGNINVAESVFEQDVFILGGELNIKGEVFGDATFVGGNIVLNNNVLGDLRVLGGTVDVKSTINGDLVIVGGQVRLSPEADIRGEIILIAAEIIQATDLSLENTIIAGSVDISGGLAGRSEITTQRISFSDGANISGELNYYAPMSATEMGTIEKTGTINFNQIKTIRETGVVKSTIINIMSFWLILRFITTLIIAFLLVQIFKYFTQKTTDIAIGSPFKSFAAGILWVFGLPLIAIILVISLIGLPVGLFLLLLYFILFLISPAISGIFAGTLVYNMFEKKETNISFQKATIGIILLTTLQFVDIVGELSLVIISMISIGAIIRFIFNFVIYKR